MRIFGRSKHGWKKVQVKMKEQSEERPERSAAGTGGDRTENGREEVETGKRNAAPVTPAAQSGSVRDEDPAQDRTARPGRTETAAGGGSDSHGNDDSRGGGSNAVSGTAGATVRRYRFPTWMDLLALVGMFLVIQLVVTMVVTLAGVHMPDSSALTSADPAVVQQAQEAIARLNFYTYPLIMGAMIVATLIYRRVRRGNRGFGHYAARGLNPVLILWGLLLMLAVNIVLEPLLQLFPPIPDLYGRGFKTILLTVVLAPVAEEFLCRGILLDAARARGGVLYGLLFSSLFFGIIHFYPAAVVNAFVMGLVLGFIYLRADSLYIVVILHAFNNALALLFLMLGYGDKTLGEMLVSGGHSTLYAVIYGVALVIFLVSGFMVWRTVSRLRREELKAREDREAVPMQ